MNNLNRYYNELYSEKVTLNSLASNILVAGYQEIKYYKSSNAIVCEAIYNQDEEEIVYKYTFVDEYLISLERICNNEVKILYSRSVEIEKLKKKLSGHLQKLA
ncbi:hypothetical protein [Proteiniclasticum sp.]|uniref:hypothetical protein n=1 Tax=Proteiniclasticum sp. TaxID=2053595 RepID=UPI00289E2DD5|nr:hypothetical protein [Proteiniclasticum sp.]